MSTETDLPMNYEISIICSYASVSPRKYRESFLLLIIFTEFHRVWFALSPNTLSLGSGRGELGTDFVDPAAFQLG